MRSNCKLQEYDEDYVTLAEDYGFIGDKPDNEDDYIYLHKGGSYSKDKPIKDIARELMKSLMEQVKDEVKSSPGKRPYACEAYRCDQKNDVEFEIACVVSKTIESN
ncbi:unnamed protein product [Heligmosomoides polygyrus]|uniref:Peptidase M12A domain-containing protein n=1 Tax=Heligmosomoides polygyrus TaxID=6339 RepID=A0A183FQQ2_HELPZ|nr:unnamed protein product [Heligmosomoides polygyrus]